MLALADMLIGPGTEFEVQSGRYLPTVSISADFMAPAPLHAWVEGRAEALRMTTSLLFAQCLITADGKSRAPREWHCETWRSSQLASC